MNSLVLDGALKILRMLCHDGFEAYIVGGYVRDRILGIEGKDIEQDFERCLNSLNLGDRISVKEITDDYKERVKRMIRG